MCVVTLDPQSGPYPRHLRFDVYGQLKLAEHAVVRWTAESGNTVEVLVPINLIPARHAPSVTFTVPAVPGD